jgi:hypothetical protein
MAKERRAPPYMRWDQRGRPVLQATLKLPDGTTVRAMLNTDDRKIAVRRMQLIVVLLVCGSVSRICPGRRADRLLSLACGRGPHVSLGGPADRGEPARHRTWAADEYRAALDRLGLSQVGAHGMRVCGSVRDFGPA